MHRPQHVVGHIGGPGDRQEFPAGANRHCWLSLLLRLARLPWPESRQIVDFEGFTRAGGR
jgi:hypothetical protein